MAKRSNKRPVRTPAINGDIVMEGAALTTPLPTAQPVNGTDDPMSDPAEPAAEDDDDLEDFSPDFLSDDEAEEVLELDGEASDMSAEEEVASDDDDDEEMDGGAPLTSRESLSPSAIPLIGASNDHKTQPSLSIAESSLPPTLQVDKPIPYMYDAGHLLILDPTPLPTTTQNTLESTFTSTARDAAQMLLNHLLTTCPIHTLSTTATSSSGVEMTLPAPVFQMPREKKVPEAKAPTKWELFAAKKGIGKKGKGGVQGRDGKMVYDEASGEWVPKWGYKGRNKKGEGDWLVEVDEKAERKKAEANGGLGLDPRSASRTERKERVKRNERAARANERKSRKSETT